jgi:hypothetical protein
VRDERLDACASYPVNFIMPIQPITRANVSFFTSLFPISRIAAGYVGCTAKFLAQTNLSAGRKKERLGFLPVHAECQETASQHRLNSKGLRNGESCLRWLRVESMTS